MGSKIIKDRSKLKYFLLIICSASDKYPDLNQDPKNYILNMSESKSGGAEGKSEEEKYAEGKSRNDSILECVQKWALYSSIPSLDSIISHLPTFIV